MLDQPKITPSSDAEWRSYYERKYRETDKQLQYIADKFAHMLRFAMTWAKEDAHITARMVARRMQYPRDKDPILDELAKWPEFAGSILREEEKP